MAGETGFTCQELTEAYWLTAAFWKRNLDAWCRLPHSYRYDYARGLHAGRGERYLGAMEALEALASAYASSRCPCGSSRPPGHQCWP